MRSDSVTLPACDPTQVNAPRQAGQMERRIHLAGWLLQCIRLDEDDSTSLI